VAGPPTAVPDLGAWSISRSGKPEGTRMTSTRRQTDAPSRLGSEADARLDAERALAIDALRLGRLLRDPDRWPAHWREPAFGIEVERYRRHMAPIRTHQSLATVYGWDVFGLPMRRVDRAEGSPIRVAFALRWLELREDATGPSWPALVR
jgi:hypothetical protein